MTCLLLLSVISSNDPFVGTQITICHSYGFDLAETHTSATCAWKKEGHNVLATITNRLGGTCKNCFHYKGFFTAWWRGRNEKDNNKTNITKNILNKNIPLSSCAISSSRSITSKLSYAAAVQQQQSIKAIADTAASGTYGPVNAEKAGICLPHELIEVTCANELNMKSVSTILLPILTQLPTSARKLSTFSEMKNILLSIPTIVDADCEVHLGLKFIKIYKDNKLILESDRNKLFCDRRERADFGNVIGIDTFLLIGFCSISGTGPFVLILLFFKVSCWWAASCWPARVFWYCDILFFGMRELTYLVLFPYQIYLRYVTTKFDFFRKYLYNYLYMTAQLYIFWKLFQYQYDYLRYVLGDHYFLRAYHFLRAHFAHWSDKHFLLLTFINCCCCCCCCCCCWNH